MSLPESLHPYPQNTTDTQSYTVPGSPSEIFVEFDWFTKIAGGDSLYVQDGTGTDIPGSPFQDWSLWPYQLSNRALRVPGDTVQIQLVSGFNVINEYGYKVVYIGATLPPIAMQDAVTIPVGQAVTTAQLLASGGAGTLGAAPGAITPRNYTFALVSGSMPAGLTLNSDGTISGTATVKGSTQVQVLVTDSQGNHSVLPLTINVIQPSALVGGPTYLHNFWGPFEHSGCQFIIQGVVKESSDGGDTWTEPDAAGTAQVRGLGATVYDVFQAGRYLYLFYETFNHQSSYVVQFDMATRLYVQPITTYSPALGSAHKFHFARMFDDGKIGILYTDSAVAHFSMWLYDPSGNTWTQLSNISTVPSPAGVSAAGVSVFGLKLPNDKFSLMLSVNAFGAQSYTALYYMDVAENGSCGNKATIHEWVIDSDQIDGVNVGWDGTYCGKGAVWQNQLAYPVFVPLDRMPPSPGPLDECYAAYLAIGTPDTAPTWSLIPLDHTYPALGGPCGAAMVDHNGKLYVFWQVVGAGQDGLYHDEILYVTNDGSGWSSTGVWFEDLSYPYPGRSGLTPMQGLVMDPGVSAAELANGDIGVGYEESITSQETWYIHNPPPSGPLPPPPVLTINKALVPSSDPGRFNLLFDGVVQVSNVGDGGTTGPIATAAGTHTAAESAAPGTSLTDYDVVIGGDANPDGSITLADGDNKVVTITNTRKPPQPPQPPIPPPGPQPPTPGPGQPGNCPPPMVLMRVAVSFRREPNLPVRGTD